VKKILLVGCGKMGGALLDGWLDFGVLPSNIFVIDPMSVRHSEWSHVRMSTNITTLPKEFHPDVIVLAVKPQIIDDIASLYAQFDNAVFLTIVAGKSLSYFARVLGNEISIIRAMTNIPASVRRGITVAISNDSVTETQKESCNDLLKAVGDIVWIENEVLMDAVTAISGSGPAYIFLLAESLIIAGEAFGLPKKLVTHLVRKTVIGTGELLNQSHESLHQLRHSVTSPGGTTFAALQVLMKQDGFTSLMIEAVTVAIKRSRELAN
jgi:pyrroline-5-carboxylate reductase